MSFLPKSFRFSARITLAALLLAALMLKASHWQWGRYLEKKRLLATFAEQDKTPSPKLSDLLKEEADLEPLLFRKISLEGEYDFKNQIVVLNRRHASGPGQLLLTPLKLKDSETRVIVSRGFIPFKHRESTHWEQYNHKESEALFGILQLSKGKQLPFSPRSEMNPKEQGLSTTWLYPDISAISAQLPYPVVQGYYLQRLKQSDDPEFPAEYVRLKVPPSTHFGYTIEWALLALFALLIAFVLQAFPDRFFSKRRLSEKPRSNDLDSSRRMEQEESFEAARKKNGSLKLH